MEVIAGVDGSFREKKSQMEILETYWKEMEVGGSSRKRVMEVSADVDEIFRKSRCMSRESTGSSFEGMEVGECHACAKKWMEALRTEMEVTAGIHGSFSFMDFHYTYVYSTSI